MKLSKSTFLACCFLLILSFHDALADHDNDREKHESKHLASVRNETFRQECDFRMALRNPYIELYGYFKPYYQKKQ